MLRRNHRKREKNNKQPLGQIPSVLIMFFRKNLLIQMPQNNQLKNKERLNLTSLAGFFLMRIPKIPLNLSKKLMSMGWSGDFLQTPLKG